MLPRRQGSFHLFQFAGINVYLHWSWFLVAVIQIQADPTHYSTPVWKVLEYLSLFLIVLMHEFGHALACRQVGGKADQIVLWPLGGVAYVDPPPRPGATLWSIAAGPLVNVALFPIFSILCLLARWQGWSETAPDANEFLITIWIINTGLLVFNLLPVYPLDGGQILRSLLWFWLGRIRSLMVAAGIGLVGVSLLILLALMEKQIWLGIVATFILINCWKGLQIARAMARLSKMPSHTGFRCPACQAAPPIGPFWICRRCHNRFDPFTTGGICPQCSAQFATTICPHCGGLYRWSDFKV